MKIGALILVAMCLIGCDRHGESVQPVQPVQGKAGWVDSVKPGYLVAGGGSRFWDSQCWDPRLNYPPMLISEAFYRYSLTHEADNEAGIPCKVWRGDGGRAWLLMIPDAAPNWWEARDAHLPEGWQPQGCTWAGTELRSATGVYDIGAIEAGWGHESLIDKTQDTWFQSEEQWIAKHRRY